jgi:hypothetical protein
MRQHLLDGVVVTRGVIVERQHQHRARFRLQHQVVHDGQRVLTTRLCDCCHRLVGRGLVVERETQRINPVGAVLDQRVHRVEEHRRVRRQIRFGQDGLPHSRIRKPLRKLIAPEFVLESAERRPVSERVISGEPEQHAEGPRRDLRIELDSVLVRLARPLQHVAPQVREPGRLDHAEGHRPLDIGCQLGHPVELPHTHLRGALTGDALRCHLEHRPAARGHRPPEAEQLLFGCVGSGYRLAVDGTVPLGARGGEAERAGLDRLLDDSGHCRDVVFGRLLVAGAAITHRVSAHRTVCDLGSEIDRERALLDGIEIFGEALPLPGDALGQRAARDVLDALHQFNEPLFAAGTDGREAHAAVPADHGGDAVQARRLQ